MIGEGRVANSTSLSLNPWSSVVEEPNQIGGWAGWGRRQRLTLPRPQVGDAGLYTCLAQSPAGEVEKSFRVRVQGKEGVPGPRQKKVRWGCRDRSVSHSLSAACLGPPHIIGPRGPRSVVGLAPGQLVLECSVEAEPAPEIEWHRDGILLQVGAGLGTRGRHLLCCSGPGPCSLDPQC